MIFRAMINGIRQTATFAALLALGSAMLLVPAGCSNTTSLDIPRLRAAPVVTVARDGAKITAEEGPRKTGTYPVFSEPLTAANVQMSDEEAAQNQARLTQLGAARRTGAITEAEYLRRVAEMRKLAAEHGSQAEAQITN